MPTKKKTRNFIITDYDQKGNVIEDLSKVVIPIERQIALLERVNKSREAARQKEVMKCH